MANAPAAISRPLARGFVEVRARRAILGVPLTRVREVLSPQRAVAAPLSPEGVVGVLNIRGRIVTAIDLGVCLGSPPLRAPATAMTIVVEDSDELYALMIEHVGEVRAPSYDLYERNPPNLTPPWKDLADGVYRMDGDIVPVLNVPRLVASLFREAA